MRTRVALVVAMMFAAFLPAQQAPKPPSWDSWKFLIGEWAGEGSGDPGQGSGWFSFKPDLQARVLVRADHSEYPASKDHPAFAHDGLMIIYQQDGRTRADYWDNEGHVIRYDATADGKTATFVSDQITGQPRYRLTYVPAGADTVKVSFAFAPPDHPDQFKTYIEGISRRKTRGLEQKPNRCNAFGNEGIGLRC